MVSLMGNSGQLPDLLQGETAPPSTQTSINKLIQLPEALLSSADIDYQTDIQPWVADEVTFALAGEDKAQTPGYLFAVVTRNAKDSQALLDHLWQKQAVDGKPLRFEQYKGISLISTDLDPSPISSASQFSTPTLKPFQESFTRLATAVFDDRYVLITNGSQVLHGIIEMFQSPNQQLTQFSDYQSAVDALQQQESWGFAFVNLSALLPSNRPYRSVAVTLGAKREGILAETVLVAAPEQPGPSVAPAVTEPIRALNYVPANSPFVLAGADLGQLWTQLSHDLSVNHRVQNWVTQSLTRWGQPWEANLPEDIFPLVQGEYTVAMLSHQSTSGEIGVGSALEPDWLFVHGASPSGSEPYPLDHSLERLTTQKRVGEIPFILDGQSVSAWTRLVNQPKQSGGSTLLSAEVTGVFTTVEDHKILATSLGALKQALTARNNPLAKQQDFQGAIAPFDQPNQGYLYLDWPRMRALAEQKLPQLRQLEQTAPTLFNRLQSLTVSNYGETPKVQRSQFFFRLGS